MQVLEHDLTPHRFLVQSDSDRDVVPRVDRHSSASGFQDVGIVIAPDSLVFLDQASSRAVRAARCTSLTPRGGTVPAVSGMCGSARSGSAWVPQWTRAITSGMPTLIASMKFPMLKWDVVEPTAQEIPVMIEPRVCAVGGAFARLDVVNISEVFHRRPKLMQSVPFMFRGVFRSATKLALQEILDCIEVESLVRAMNVLVQSCTRRFGSPEAVGDTVQVIPRRQWIQLFNESAVSWEKFHTQSFRRRRRAQDDDNEAKRVARATSLVQVGESSAARQALEGVSLVSRTLATLKVLLDPERRPPVPKQGVSRKSSKPLPNNLRWNRWSF